MFESGKLLKEKKKLGWFDSLSLFDMKRFEKADTSDMLVEDSTITALLNDVVIDAD